MDLLVWSAACRLAGFVGLLLAAVGPPLVRDALAHRGTLVSEICGACSALFVVVALVAMARASRFFAHSEPAPPVAVSYRNNARATIDDPPPSQRGRATRDAASALMAFVAAGALVIVAAASR